MKERMKCLSISQLKILACILMFLDHFAAIFGWEGHNFFPLINDWNFRMLGRAAFPIFAFSLVNGWEHTSDRKKYIYHLGCFACISQIPYVLALNPGNCFQNSLTGNSVFRIGDGWWSGVVYMLVLAAMLTVNQWMRPAVWPLLTGLFLSSYIWIGVCGIWLNTPETNVGFTLLAGLLCFSAIDYFQKGQKKTLKEGLMYLCFLWIALWLCRASDYGYFGLALMILLYITRRRQMIQCCIGIAWSVCLYGIYIQNVESVVGASCGFLLLLLYNGKRGELPKKFFYFFYPVHLLVLGICAVLMLLVH